MADGATRDRDVVYVTRATAGTLQALTHLQELGWNVHRATAARDVLKLVQREPDRPFAALLDLRDGFDESAIAAFGGVLSAPNVGWVAGVETPQLQLPAVRRLVRDYCADYVTLPCPEVVLDTVIGHAHGMARLACESARRVGDAGLDGIVGESPAVRALARALCKAATTDAPVFIAGETGTGKELAAQALHRKSRRSRMPFVAINCGAIPHSLIQSELFGYERGAFTGAGNRKLGRIEMANGGTLFLDEVGDLPMESQASLLRFLQQGSFERLGGHDMVRVDVRIVSATHHDLEAAIREGRFRADLYHRLCVLRLVQPPLRDRGHDIDLLADHALRCYSAEGQRLIKGFSPCARRALHGYAWPGNVRELINRVRQAVVMAEGRFITAADLGLDDLLTISPPTLEDVRNAATRHALMAALDRNQGRMMDTANELDISRVTLYRLLQRYGLHPGDEAPDADAAIRHLQVPPPRRAMQLNA